MTFFRKKCEYCRNKIDRGQEHFENVKIPGYVGTFKKVFCSKDHVLEYINKMKVRYDIVDITKNPKILQKYQVMSAPGIVINGKLEFSGVPSKKELEEKLKNN